jgi:hypothetical protein
MPVLPLIFDTIPELGATKLRATFPYPFLHLRESFETLAVVVTFSRFWAGKFHIHAKIRCVIANHCHGVSPTKQNKKIQKGWSQIRRTGARGCFERETELWAGNEISPHTGRDWSDRHGDRDPANTGCP